MPISVRLETEEGVAVAVEDPNGGECDGAGDFDRLIPFDDPSYACRRFVDPYGDTIFNGLQARQVLLELDRLDLHDASEIERKGVARLRSLVAACAAGVHLYVRFIGD